MKLSEMPRNTNSSKTNSSSSSNFSSINDSKHMSQNKSIKETYEELKDSSSDDLMQRLAKEINLQKSNGTFDYEALKASIEKVKIYLPAGVYGNMIKIIDGLK